MATNKNWILLVVFILIFVAHNGCVGSTANLLDTESSTDSIADSDTDTNTYFDTDSNTDQNTDSNTEKDTATDSYTDTDTNIETDSEWHTFFGSSNRDYGMCLAADTTGGIITAGYSTATWNGPNNENPLHDYSGKNDLIILKLTDKGEYQWHTFFGSLGNNYSQSLGVDLKGNIYITGYSEDAWNGPKNENPLHDYSGKNDFFILKLNAKGVYQWHTFFGSSNSDASLSIIADTTGEVYITGQSDAAWNGPDGQNSLHTHSGGDDVFILKLNSAGQYQWHTFYGSSKGDYGLSIALDENGDVYVAGNSITTWNGSGGEVPLHSFTGNTYDLFVIKLNSFGTYQWHTFYGSSSRDYSKSLIVDRNCNIYITGQSHALWKGPKGQDPLNTCSDGDDLFVLKLSPAGEYQWHMFLGSLLNDEGRSLAVDGNSDIYITGTSSASWNGPGKEQPLNTFNTSPSGTSDIFILKLSEAGKYYWHTFLGSSNADYGYSISIDGNNNAYVTGWSYGTWNGPSDLRPLHAHSGYEDIFVLKIVQ